MILDLLITLSVSLILFVILDLATFCLLHTGIDQESNSGFKFYLSPEQLRAKVWDAKADVFALGVIFFELNCPFVSEELRFEV